MPTETDIYQPSYCMIMADAYAQAIAESDLTRPQQRHAQKELTKQLQSYIDDLKKGDRFVNMGKNVEAAHAYIEAVFRGAPDNLVDPRFKRVAKQLEAKGTDMTPTERRVLYEIGTIGENYIHEHKRKTEPVFHISPVHSAAFAVIAIAAVVLGTLGISATAQTTGFVSTSGSSSMVLAAFILLALLYFYVLRPKK